MTVYWKSRALSRKAGIALPGCHPDTVGQKITDALAMNHSVDQGLNGRAVAPPEFKTTRIQAEQFIIQAFNPNFLM